MNDTPTLTPLTANHLPILNNLGHFYEYDMARNCGWQTPKDGMFRPHQVYYERYITETNRFGYLVEVNGELAGFALINADGSRPNIDFHVGEFFIIGKFQGRGIGRLVAHDIWTRHPGRWEITVIPENTPGLSFWRKTVTTFQKNSTESSVLVPWDTEHPERISFEFSNI